MKREKSKRTKFVGSFLLIPYPSLNIPSHNGFHNPVLSPENSGSTLEVVSVHDREETSKIERLQRYVFLLTLIKLGLIKHVNF